MKLKRIAIRGLVTLAVVVCVCMFFARTVLTITTPKVQIVTATSGRLEQKMTFKGAISFPETEEILFKDAQKSNVLIKKVLVKEGQKVSKGDPIYTCELPSLEEDMKKLQAAYDEKNKTLLDLDIKNRGSSKESRQNELYNAMLDSQEDMTKLAAAARTSAAGKGITLASDISMWRKQLAALGEEVPEEITKAASLAVAAKNAYDEAYSAFFAILEDRKLRVSSDVFEYIRARDEAIEAMNAASEDMAELSARAIALQKLTADHDGYIVTLPLKAGDTYDGVKAAYVMSKEDSTPTLRIPLSNDMKRTIMDGTKAEIVVDEYTTEKTTVEKTEVDKDGVKYLYLVLPETYLSSSSGVRKLMGENGVDINITYKAKSATTLLPPSAVRNEGEGNDYVYLIQQSYGGFMSASSMKVVKTNVTVIERSDKSVSLSDDLTYQQVADREDRALSDGQSVMEYVK